MNDQVETMWITKYALTKGIFKATGTVARGEPVEYLYAPNIGLFARLGKDAHRTREAAVERAKEMQHKKICALQKQSARIQNLTFE